MFILLAFALTICASPAWGNNPNPNSPPKGVGDGVNFGAQETRASGTGGLEDSLLRLERQWLDAWVKRDLKTIDGLWADDAFGVAERRYSKPDLGNSATLSQLGEYSIADLTSISLGPDAAVLSYRLDLLPNKGYCYASSAWVRRDSRWSLVWHQDGPANDTATRDLTPGEPTVGNPRLRRPTQTASPLEEKLLQNELRVQDSWKRKDTTTLDSLWADGFLLIRGQRYPKNLYLRGVSLIGVKDYTVTDIQSRTLGSEAGLISYLLALQLPTNEDGVVAKIRSYTTSVWLKHGTRWSGVFRHDTPINPN